MNVRRIAYGAGPDQFGELSLPAGASAGLIVLIHGGFWRARYDLSLARPLAADLVARGYTCWNLEYRRAGADGGWPSTFADVGAGLDAVADIADIADTSRAVLVGHSAGGQLAAWAAARATLPAGAPGAAPRVLPVGVIAQAGVLDLAGAATAGVGATAVPDLLGGLPDAVPERYRLTDPTQQLPLPVPVWCIHARGDANVPFTMSENYVAAAGAAGARAALHEVVGDHFTLIDPTTPAWADTCAALPALLAGRLP